MNFLYLDADPDEFFKHWYYDNAQPEDMSGSHGTPHYPNRWDLCSHRVTGQVL